MTRLTCLPNLLAWYLFHKIARGRLLPHPRALRLTRVLNAEGGPVLDLAVVDANRCLRGLSPRLITRQQTCASTSSKNNKNKQVSTAEQ
ncbi:uncharacterized protein BO87DRAFT_379845 [Aspergillus neoniger CBS 115656]|uniref:Uncharacterized protein n=1 Tax=Aspergillus neoniger (strain CBS 115656) TaxID=1448310 RepID=A0A318Y7U8_ASPNB|nr:hypothetical protein BO87DRAFT_379845 [Aspergillus neoniger CBS 115656]PYH30385.1 hypothetical protein BO87DRAFT_379845 [Aspergillus neoniger CBS 115656]